MRRKVYGITLAGILSALAAIAFFIENLFPPLFVPGAKMGLSNIFVLFALISVGKCGAFAVLSVKIVLGSLLSGNISAVMYGLPAGLVSLTAEILLFEFASKLSVTAISVCGAMVNSTVQNAVFCIVTSDAGYFVYLPYLALISAISGLIVGLAVYLLVKFIPLRYLSQERETKDISSADRS